MIWGRVKQAMESVGSFFDDLLNTHRGPDYVDRETLDVAEFLTKFGHLTRPPCPTHLTQRKLRERLECMQEELNEFKDGIELQDLAAQADALIDLVYFAKGTAIMLGLPWEDLWTDVQGANMDKIPGVGKRGHKVDLIKPMGWIPPMTLAILQDHQYNRRLFTNNHDQVLEGHCRDDA